MNLFAYTAMAGYVHYPAYISINRRGGNVQITVRGPEKDGRCGADVTVELPEAEWGRFKDELRRQDGWIPATFVTEKIDYAEKCKLLRADGPSPCLCCAGECVG